MYLFKRFCLFAVKNIHISSILFHINVKKKRMSSFHGEYAIELICQIGWKKCRKLVFDFSKAFVMCKDLLFHLYGWMACMLFNHILFTIESVSFSRCYIVLQVFLLCSPKRWERTQWRKNKKTSNSKLRMVTTWKKNDLGSLIPFVCFFFMTVKLVLPCFNSESWNEPYSPGNIFKLLLQRNHDKINWLINSSVAIILRRIDSKFKIQMINSMHGTYKYGIVRIFLFFLYDNAIECSVHWDRFKRFLWWLASIFIVLWNTKINLECERVRERERKEVLNKFAVHVHTVCMQCWHWIILF